MYGDVTPDAISEYVPDADVLRYTLKLVAPVADILIVRLEVVGDPTDTLGVPGTDPTDAGVIFNVIGPFFPAPWLYP